MEFQKKHIAFFFYLFAGFVTVSCSIPGGGGAAAPQSRVPPFIDEQSRKEVFSGSISNDRAAADMKTLASQPVRTVYKIGTSDLLDIQIFQAQELSRQVRVDQKGNITLPLLGLVRVAGLSQNQLEKRLADLLGRDLMRNPQVSVFIKEYTAQRVTIEGEVKNQGVYPLTGELTVLQAIALAGGLEKSASVKDVVLFRKKGQNIQNYIIDLDLIRKGIGSDPSLRNDDRIVVHRLKDKRVTVDGEVVKPGVYSFKDKISLLQAVAMAQGLTSIAASDKVSVFRLENNQERVYTVNLTKVRDGVVPDPAILSNDRIVVHRSNGRFWLKELAPLVSPINALSAILAR